MNRRKSKAAKGQPVVHISSCFLSSLRTPIPLFSCTKQSLILSQVHILIVSQISMNPTGTLGLLFSHLLEWHIKTRHVGKADEIGIDTLIENHFLTINSMKLQRGPTEAHQVAFGGNKARLLCRDQMIR